MKSPVILVIDEQKSSRDTIRAILAPDGFAVLEAADVASGLRMLNQSSPDLILMDFNLKGKNGLELALDVKANDIDVERASNDRGGEKAFGGRGSIDLELRQHMTAGGQWASSLNGLWKISLIKGYMQDRGRDRRRRGKPTPITRCSASGNIRSGVIRSSDFFYLGDDLQAQGGGWLHLVRKQLDCNLSVKMGRIPPFPVRVYGPLDKPQTSIGAGTALLRILGSIAGSVGDVIGGLFGSIGQLMSK